MRASFCSCDIIQRIRSMLKVKLMLLLYDLLKLLLEKIIYYPESFLRHSEDGQQSKDDSDHQLEVLNFEDAATSDPTWLHMQVPVVPVVNIDTEFIKKQLPVVLYRDLILKKTSSQRQFQATSSSSEQEMHKSSCIVCMNSMEGRDEVRELCNCEHVFHRDCLDAWIGQAQLTCPLCRSELLIPAPTSATTSKQDKDGGRDPWRAERMIYLFGEDIFFTI
ncbi:ERAD-associated E3 ubiquitin-protein ligase HRD1-like [Rosa rugosa]|uniref:ERAD-associated E3 ubiquitin-protein ligase HRD1-like n=1 Tax=Rosa rugosa TaxID=74645 RepID=UPI002B41526B|nr:ERAD-associated E3 ubiquitin-protein ligase HRD1-like [Rosa rugosa]